MHRFFEYNNSKIRYKDQGNGKPIVLLHGYLESLDIWHNFAEKLAGKYRVISLDIPGHGSSDVIAETHTMDLMADIVHSLLSHQEINKCLLVGHSMGGYVTLAFADKYMDRLDGFILFHSSPFPDTDDKKDQRNREKALIREGKKIFS